MYTSLKNMLILLVLCLCYMSIHGAPVLKAKPITHVTQCEYDTHTDTNVNCVTTKVAHTQGVNHE